MIKIWKNSIRNNAISLSGCWHYEETIVKERSILFKQKMSANYKPYKQMEKDIIKGKSSIPPIND
jgi:hypothetical protein